MDAHTTLVTGASKGIGRAVADLLAAQGHTVIGLARRPPAAGFPGRFETVDLADAATTSRVMSALAREYRIDGLVNNVGLVDPEPLEGLTPERLAGVMDLNLRPALQAAQAVIPGMRAGKWGRIVNVSSLTVLGARNRSAYAGAKAALISFTRAWALELAPTGITVNAVAPGPTETELFRANNPRGSEAEQRLLAQVPLGRFGRPHEIAAAIVFFFSDDAGYITGQTLFVDGGSSIGRSLL